MKTRFSTLDIRAAIAEIREQFVSLRAVNIYDVDSKTYIVKFNKPDSKMMLLMESGNRLHITEYEWPKNATPSGFTMKLRKHLRSRRLESVNQLGTDRIVDLQFGSGDAAYHVILELYDRGNIVLTDSELVILNILRPRTDESQDVRFAVKEKYPVELAKKPEPFIGQEGLRTLLQSAQPGDNLRKILNPVLPYGPAIVEHCLLTAGFPPNAGIGKGFSIEQDLQSLYTALEEAESMMVRSASVCRGYIVQRAEQRAAAPAPAADSLLTPGDASGGSAAPAAMLLTYDEFHPFLLKQHSGAKYVEFDTFNKAVDEFFSKLEAQKIDLKALQAEKAALRKLDNVKKDHEKRLTELQQNQEEDEIKANLIEMNLPLVDRAIVIVNSSIASQLEWASIWELVQEAKVMGDPVALAIKSLKLDTNHMTLLLQNPYSNADESSDEDSSADGKSRTSKPMKVDIDLGLSAFANAKKYYDHRRVASDKMQKTVLASSKALRSAERTTKEMLKDAQSAATINKARRVNWFEKFLWLITSENYLAVGGRDAQQNEIIVKRHMRPGDVYVHADLHGASSIIIKNPTGAPIPPKTLNEVGCMALCNSAAWDAKVVTSAWWVYHDQVSKTAPTGEYLTTGSFMVRGKKNYLPPSHLVYGFGLLFKLDEESTARHRGERRVRTIEEEEEAAAVAHAAAAAASSAPAVGLADPSGSAGGGSDAELSLGSDSSDDEASTATDVSRKNQAVGALQMDASPASVSAPTIANEATVGTGPHDEVQVKIEDQPGGSPSSSDDESAFPDTRIRVPSVNEGDSLNVHIRFAPKTRSDSMVKDEVGGPYSSDRSDPDRSANSAAVGDGFQRVVVGTAVLEIGRKVSRERKPEEGVGSGHGSRGNKQNQVQQKQQYRGTGDDSEAGQSRNVSGVELTQQRNSDSAKAGTRPQEKQQQQQQQAAAPKRGQRAKLRKIKEKYGDQDEEERQLRMSLLRSAPPPPPPRVSQPSAPSGGKAGAGRPASSKTGKGGSSNRPATAGSKPAKIGAPAMPQDQQKTIRSSVTGVTSLDGGQQQQLQEEPQPMLSAAAGRTVGNATVTGEASDRKQRPVQTAAGGGGSGSEAEEEEGDDQAEGAGLGATADLEMLDSLTGRPSPEDVLLFAIPFCAPYSVLQSFKFKVKLTPGTTKRGKASKTAIQSFLFDKTITPREKDLIKALKDVDVSRNMPGKVKVLAPNLNRAKGK